MDAPEDRLGFAVVTRVLAAEGGEARDLLEEVVRLLESVLPGQVEVRRASRLRGHRVEEVEAELGDRRFTLQNGRRITASVANVVRGVVLKTEEVGVDRWIELFAHALADEADRNADARAALARLAV